VSNPITELLQHAHGVLARELLARIESGDAKGQDLEILRKFLKDNNIEAIPAEGTPLGDLANKLKLVPDFDDEEDAA
jgi:hypothetical protein